MTTLVYRDGVLASDSLICSGDHVEQGYYQKIFRLADGRLMGFAGSLSLGLKLLERMTHEEELEYEEELTWEGAHMEGVMVAKDGTMYCNEGCGVWVRHRGPYGAWGSGSSYAYGALAMGASAAEAVKVAAKFDKHTGGPVRVLKLDAPKAKRKN